MSQLRRNSITGHWVILAENRGGRPQEVDVQQIARPQAVCPFCAGHENRTPAEVLAIRTPGGQPNGPGWQVRVVPNKFPALENEAGPTGPQSHAIQVAAAASPEVAPGAGIHEIIVESPRHLASITELDDAHVASILQAYHQRVAALRQTKKFRSALIFKNGGPLAGATLLHLHSQLLAFQLGAPIIGDRLPNFQTHAARFGDCPLCQNAKEVSADDQCIVAGTPNFLAFCPFAARFAYETWIIPRQHVAHFDATAPETLSELASLLRMVLVKLERIVKLSAYNYIVHTAPFDTTGSDHYHWHIEILPRTTSLAGFELGIGCYINTVLPERAAAALREA